MNIVNSIKCKIEVRPAIGYVTKDIRSYEQNCFSEIDLENNKRKLQNIDEKACEYKISRLIKLGNLSNKLIKLFKYVSKHKKIEIKY